MSNHDERIAKLVEFLDQYSMADIWEAEHILCVRHKARLAAADVASAREWIVRHDRDGWPAGDEDYWRRMYCSAELPLPPGGFPGGDDE